MKFLYRFIILFLFFHGFLLGQTSDSTIVLKDVNELLPVGKQTYLLEDSEAKLSIEDILKPETQNSFRLLGKDVFSSPPTKSAFWFKVTVQNQSEEDAWLEIGTSFAWYIDFYVPDKNGNYGKAFKTGTMRPEANKFYNIINAFWLPVNKTGMTESQIYYIRILEEPPYEVPLRVGTIRSLLRIKSISDFLSGSFVGLIVIMLLYNSFIYISTRDKIYLLYLGYMAASLFNITFTNSYPLINAKWFHIYFPAWQGLSLVFIGYFTIYYLELKTKIPWVSKLIFFEVFVLGVIIPILNLVGVTYGQLVNFMQLALLLQFLTCIGVSYYLAFKGYRQARFYALGWTFAIGSIIIVFLVVNGILVFNIFTRYAMYYGVAIEIWMFSLALGDRLNIMRREKESAQKSLLAKTKENEKILSEQNVILEGKVKERTEKLEETLKSVQQLKNQQDGDYFLTSLLLDCFQVNEVSSGKYKVDFYLSQKKKFSFKNKNYEIGGDVNIAVSVVLNNKPYIVFLNGDAMGKSTQGAGGVLVLGTAFTLIIERLKSSHEKIIFIPSRWLVKTIQELHKTFLTFQGSMNMSAILGIIDETEDELYFLNAEHPYMVLLRDQKAEFIGQNNINLKLGYHASESRKSVITKLKLKPGDIVISGSDGRDDLVLDSNFTGNEKDLNINTDETIFLRNVEKGNGELDSIAKNVMESGKLIDDFSMLKVGRLT